MKVNKWVRTFCVKTTCNQKIQNSLRKSQGDYQKRERTNILWDDDNVVQCVYLDEQWILGFCSVLGNTYFISVWSHL